VTDDAPATRTGLILTVSELSSSLQRTKCHLVVVQIVISTAVFVALKLTH
jgi:hypothetical protein